MFKEIATKIEKKNSATKVPKKCNNNTKINCN